jgi:hypothetical protein
MFKKGEVVKVKDVVVPSGPVLSMRFNDAGVIEYLIEWKDAQGELQQRWFTEDRLEA